MKNNEKIMESLEDFRTSLLEVEVLRQEVKILLEETFPEMDDDYDYVDYAMVWFYFGIESVLYSELRYHCFHAKREDRDIRDFFDASDCPYDLACEINSRKGKV